MAGHILKPVGARRRRNSAAIAALACALAMQGGAAWSQTPTAPIEIAAQPLAQALMRLSRQMNVDIVAPGRLTKGLIAPAVGGTMSVEEALGRLLAHSNLRYRRAGNGFVVEAAQTASRPLGGGEAGFSNSASSLGEETRQAEASGDDAEIIVTAERRQQRLTDAPLSVSVLSDQDIARRGLTQRSDYLRSVPSVSLRDDGPGQSELVIRGAYGDAFRTGPTVGLYLNDVPLTGFVLGGSADVRLIDVQRVEILRGPQGTLYGSNALSGAIKYVTASPELNRRSVDFEFGYSRTAKFGGDNYFGQAVVNIPISDTLAVRAVAFHDFRSGYVRGIAGSDPTILASAVQFGARGLAGNKERLGDAISWGVRLSARWQPLPNLDFDFLYTRQTDSQDDRLFELAKDGPYRRADFALAPSIGGPEGALRLDLDLYNLRAKYDFGWGSLYSSTAKMNQRYVRKFEIGTLLGSPVRPVSQISDTDAGIFTQEVRFTSAFDGPFQLIGGLYYEDSDQPTEQATYFGGDPARNPYPAVKLYQFHLDRIVTQKAAFGEISFEPLEGLKFTVGGRAFQYKSRFQTISTNSVVSFVTNSTSDIRTKESGQTYKARIEYKPGRNALVYGSFSQGFRLGRPLATDLIRSLCDRDNDGLLDGTSVSSRLDRVGSDRLDAYEIGAKLAFAGGRGSLTGAVYQNDWKGLPITFQPPGCLTSTSINGGNARARGFEVEGVVPLLAGLRGNFGFGYVDSILTSTTSLGPAGSQLNFTPKINGNAGLEYDFLVADDRTFIRGDYNYFGSYYTQTGKRGIRAAPYGVVNLSAGVEFRDGLRLQVEVQNLFDNDAFTSVLGPSGFPAGYGVRLRPRTVGMKIGYSFQ